MRFDLPDEKTLTHEMIVPIRWGDMDAMGHVNNTIYFRYMEIVRLDWLFKTCGEMPDANGDGFVIVNAFANFHLQLAFPGDLLVKHYVANPGRSSFDTFLTIERTDEPGRIYSSGGAKTVWMNFGTGRSVAMPGHVRALLV